MTCSSGLPAMHQTAVQMSLPGTRPAGTEELFAAESTGETAVEVSEESQGRGRASVLLKHILEAECGSHILRTSCALWVYNCTSMPLAVRQGEERLDMVRFTHTNFPPCPSSAPAP